MNQSNDLESKRIKDLYKAVAQLKTASEVQKFMRDLCSRGEIETMAERWEIVRFLQEEIPYRAIAKKTGASTATITRVAQWLHHGMGGYELMLNRSTRGGLSKATGIIASHLNAQKAIEKAKNSSHTPLTKKAASHSRQAIKTKKSAA